MSDGRIVIAIPDVPPSLNRWLSSHWRVKHREKQVWQNRLHNECWRWKLPTDCARIEATVSFRFRTAHRRDTGNYSSTLEKCLGDALRPMFIADDDAPRFQMTSASIESERGADLTTITLDYWLEEKAAA